MVCIHLMLDYCFISLNHFDFDFNCDYKIPFQMMDLEKKLLSEANEEAKIIACRFPLPNLKPIRVIGDGIDTVWLYTLKK